MTVEKERAQRSRFQSYGSLRFNESARIWGRRGAVPNGATGEITPPTMSEIGELGKSSEKDGRVTTPVVSTGVHFYWSGGFHRTSFVLGLTGLQ